MLGDLSRDDDLLVGRKAGHLDTNHVPAGIDG